MLDNMQIGVTQTDTDGEILCANPAVAQMHGYGVDELVGGNLSLFEESVEVKPSTGDWPRGSTSWASERIHKRKDGTTLIVRALAGVVSGSAGGTIVTSFEDVTERRLAEEALRLMEGAGFRRRAKRYDIRPDAIERFGYLSEIIQVKASIVLRQMFRNGICLNVDAADRLEQQHREQLSGVVADIERHHRDVLTYDRHGALRLKPTAQTPSLGSNKLISKLEEVASELKTTDAGFQKPMSQGKKGGISRSIKAWESYAERHAFIDRWCRMERSSKMLQFFKELKSPRLHCEYSVLMRTGRTSCSRPRDKSVPGINLQQIPGDAAFRGLFIAEPGHLLFTADYKAIELRTLAAVCRARYGQSRLGDVIAEGIDPHANTAASILSLIRPRLPAWNHR